MIDYCKSFNKEAKLTGKCNEIQRCCNDFDGLNTPFFIDSDYRDFSDTPWLYYAMDHGQMIGFLSVYEIDRFNSEVCLFILPTYRRKKIATHLFSMMVMDFPSKSFQVSISPLNDFGKSFLLKTGFVYCSTECSMQLMKSHFTPYDKPLSLIPQKQDSQIVVQAKIDETSVGSALLSVFGETVCIHDVEIYEDFRGKGYGYQFIMTLLNHIFAKYDRVVLHVTKNNIPAYKLYQKAGFSCTETLDYYEL